MGIKIEILLLVCIMGEDVTTVSSKVFETIELDMYEGNEEEEVIDICCLTEIVEVGNEGGCVNTENKPVNYNMIFY